ncbi:MAG: hypothetical protein IJ523_06250 [Succinivibrionaceae bacterium]|nr:hypothetical protein [Succinivibrionaceae bacterium]
MKTKQILKASVLALVMAPCAMAAGGESGMNARQINAICDKMKPAIYTKNDAGTITRKGCHFKDRTYTLTYEVAGEQKYINDMKNSGLVNKNAKDGDAAELKKYCKAYAWLYRQKDLTKKIVVEYRDTAGKILASTFINTSDCR